ncbi:TetR family transcriptional regulator [Hyphomonas adhaerens MHS-3]|uniref:TetR family transcriptional regulator n=1 Tax=Hyphomonas adhaerens MHS-3 TaxID=1280949 RepID=A0A069E7Z9_9PROT|nr:TetR/AcrR family transcriptional regulator [Hyphomonas adhaerens]KCZ86104.1 TetR family transcriptional regulator [Hyphomonas adhaerens MHS-3]
MPANTSSSRASFRGARTRRSLIDAGLQLFAKRPVDAVPIDDIVAVAGVAKGSFFNHFEDKKKFASAIATEIRLDIEARVVEANRDLTDPLERLAGGMRTAATYALTEQDRAIIMVNGFRLATGRDHPLNAGLKRDMDAASAAGLLRPEAQEAGLLFWLGACHSVMANIIERGLSRPKAAARVHDLMVMALTGLGVDQVQSRKLAKQSMEQMLKSSR